MKRCVTCLVTLAVLMVSAAVVQCATATAGALQRAPLSAAFKEWRAGNTVSGDTASSRAVGLVPALAVAGTLVGGDSSTAARSSSLLRAAVLPSRYDLRDVGGLTAVRDQGERGTCWAFASYGSLESTLLLAGGGVVDLSEDNLALCSGYSYDAYNGGGNAIMATAYLARWAGPVLEADDAYGDGKTPSGLKAQTHTQNVEYLPKRAGATDNDAIKQTVMDSGAVYAEMYWDSGCYRSTETTSCYFYSYPEAYDPANDTVAANHAVAIVGWDDDYSKSNFATVPEGDGAFIVRNSWGAGWGEDGCFYVSYYDSVFARGDAWGVGDTAVFTAEDATNHDAIYQYDPLGYVYACYVDASDRDTGWIADRFTATHDGALEAVSFYTLGEDTAYQVYVDSSLSPDPADLVAAGTLSAAGYHTVPLSTRPAATAGKQFYVMVRIETPGCDYPLALEGVCRGYSEQATSSPGRSFVGTDADVAAGSWADVGGGQNQYDVCLKAFADEVPLTTATGLAADAHSAWANGPVEVGLSADGGFALTTYYRVDAANDGAWSVYTAPFTVLGDGSHTVEYYTVDETRATEKVATGYVNIDTAKPTARARAASVRKVNARKGKKLSVRVVLRDARPTCGRARLVTTITTVSGAVVGRAVKKNAATNATHTMSVTLTRRLKKGTYIILTRATDKAGNKQAPVGRSKLIVR